MVFDIRAQQWSAPVSFTAPGYVVNWTHTPDYKSVVYTTGGADPMLFRVRLADRKIEAITSLKGLHRATGPAGNTEIGVALTVRRSSPATLARRRFTRSE
jgi:hypothetical protein